MPGKGQSQTTPGRMPSSAPNSSHKPRGQQVPTTGSPQTQLEMLAAAGTAELLTRYLSFTDKKSINQQQNVTGLTALHFAVCSGSVEKVKLLLDAGADHRIGDLHGVTPLMYACNNRAPAVATALVEKGADLQQKDKFAGGTALHRVAVAGYKDMCEHLLKLGADPQDVDNEGRIPLDVCANPEIVQLLQEAMRKKDRASDKAAAQCANCHKCESDGVKLKSCQGCRAVRYCGRSCQVAHWAEHKAHCSHGAPLIIQLSDEMLPGTGLSFTNWHINRQAKSPRLDPTPVTADTCESRAPAFKSDERFLLKIQIAEGGYCPLCVYNQGRTILGYLHKPGQEAAFEKLVGLLRQRGFNQYGTQGVTEGEPGKVYLWAAYDAERQLQVFPGKLADMQPW